MGQEWEHKGQEWEVEVEGVKTFHRQTDIS